MEKTYKRTSRAVSPETKQKISSTLKAYNSTHPRTDTHKQRIADGLKTYWQQIPKSLSMQDSLENGDIV